MQNDQTKIDERFLAAAIRLARVNEGQTGTNPSVACVLVRKEKEDFIIVGTGVTAIGGRPHAEPIALLEAGEKAKGATAYVTLEPCAHHGSTPPCAQALINAGVTRVVTACVDPDERVNQLGHQMLSDANIKVSAGCLSDKAQTGLSAYLNHKHKNRSYVTVKIAVSIDGFMGIKGAGQVAITGPLAKAQTHLMRARHHAILIGAQTVIEDDPDLTCRLNGLEHRSPIRIILDPNERVPLKAKLFKTANQVRTIVVCSVSTSAKRRKDLESLGVEILSCDLIDTKIALPELLEDLGAIGILNVMVEGGAKTVDAFLRVGLIDEIFYYKGNKAIGADASSKDLIKSPISENVLNSSFQQISKITLGDDQIIHYTKADRK